MKPQDDNQIILQENPDSIQSNEFFKTATELFSVGEWELDNGIKYYDEEPDIDDMYFYACYSSEYCNSAEYNYYFNDYLSYLSRRIDYCRSPLCEYMTYESRIEVSGYIIYERTNVPIWRAAVKGHWDIVIQWIEQYPSLIIIIGGVRLRNSRILDDLSLFHLASMLWTDIKVLKRLVSLGADVNAISQDSTPLHCAVMDGNANIAVMQYLISLGIDVNAKDHHGCTPLYVAAIDGNSVEILAYLISLGAEVNAKDRHGRTPLYVTAKEGRSVETLTYLISQGADVNARGNGNETQLHLAIREESLEVAQFLVSEGADINAKDEFGDTPLHDAILNYGFTKPKRDIFKYGHCANTKGKIDFISLFGLGVQDGNIEIIKNLVSQGADVNAKNNNGKTPLYYWAIRYGGSLEVGALLISQGADVNIKDNDGNTPLHFAAYNYHDDPAFAELLVFQGADMNAKNNNGETPLHWAANRNDRQNVWDNRGDTFHVDSEINAEIIKYLIFAGADTNVKNKNGKTPFDVAKDVLSDVTKESGKTVKAGIVEYLSKPEQRKFAFGTVD